MKILMLLPYAFLKQSGSSLSTYYRIKALVDLGNQVDVLAFPFGQAVDIGKGKIIRCARVPFINKLESGSVIPKIPLSLSMLVKCIRILKNSKYDLLYTHGTSGLIGMFMKAFYKLPLIQEMHGLWEYEIIKWNFYPNKIVSWFAALLENLIIRNSDAIVTTCRNITDKVIKVSKGKSIFTIENAAEEINSNHNKVNIRKLREKYGINNQKIIMYTGSFLKIQNIDWLIECSASLTKTEKNVMCFLIGGSHDQVIETQRAVALRGLSDHFIILESRSKEEVVHLLNLTDILVSPRTIGIEIPLKIITYLQSGKAIVATNCPIHSQILNDKVALLTEPNIDGFLRGIQELLHNEEMRLRLGINAKKTYMKMYSYKAYKNKMENLCLYLMKGSVKLNTS